MKKLNFEDLDQVAGGISMSTQARFTADEATQINPAALARLGSIPGVTVHAAGSPGYAHGGFSTEAKDNADMDRISAAIDEIFPDED